MDYKIIGQTVPVVEMKLNRGETVYTQSGGMAYQSEGLKMTTNARGGIMLPGTVDANATVTSSFSAS